MSNDNEEGVYDLLEKAEQHLIELNKIHCKLTKPASSVAGEQAYFGLSKSITTSRRHISLLMGIIEANGATDFK